MTRDEFGPWIEKLHARVAETLMKGHDHQMQVSGDRTGVFCGSKSTFSELFVNRDDPLARELHAAGFSLEEAWLLVLSHESGHIELNDRCIGLGLDPSDPNMQMEVLGLPHVCERRSFHKESAIEAFCDATYVNYAFDALGDRWEVAVKILLTLRDHETAKIRFLEGDGYATQPCLQVALATKKKIDPKEAALIVLNESMRQETPLLRMIPRPSEIRDAIAASADKFTQISESLKVKITKRRGVRNGSDTANLTTTEDNPRNVNNESKKAGFDEKSKRGIKAIR